MLGYNLVAIPLTPETKTEETTRIREMCSKIGLDLVTRIDLHPKNQNELLNQLRKCRRKFEIVAVQCENKDVARQAAKDRRVDLLDFPLLDSRRRFFDKAEAELASSSLAALEIDTKPLFMLEGPPRARLLSTLRKEVTVALDFGLPIIVSSGISDSRLLRSPLEIAAVTVLCGLTREAGLDATSKNPTTMVQRNRQKLSKGYVAPGIRILKEGKDC